MTWFWAKKEQLQSDQRGVAHLLLIVGVVVIVGVIGFAGYKVVGNKDDHTDTAAPKTTQAATEAAAKAQCDELNDDDLCKFYTKYMTHDSYRMKSTSSDGTTMTVEVAGDNSHTVITGATAYETVLFNKAYYTKAGDTWYKQAVQSDNQSESVPKVDLGKPTTDEKTTTDEAKTVYKKIGKETCGDLQCFKYQVTDPAASGTVEYIWFDDQEYQLRKMTSATDQGTNEITFEYGNISVKEPSPVKELTASQYIMPGSNEVMTLPTTP